MLTVKFNRANNVCAWRLVSLQTLNDVLNLLRVKKVDNGKVLTLLGLRSTQPNAVASLQLTETRSLEKVKEVLGEIDNESHKSSLEKRKSIAASVSSVVSPLFLILRSMCYSLRVTSVVVSCQPVLVSTIDVERVLGTT